MIGSTVLGSLTLSPSTETDELLIATLTRFLENGGSLEITTGGETHWFSYELPGPKLHQPKEQS